MTTPAGVPNLPIGALTVETLGQKLQDQTAGAMRTRAGEQMPSIFGMSTGGDIMSDLSPFGILTNIWAGINSLIANASPADIQGPEDLPPLFLDFIENLPVIGQFVELLEALAGTYTGDDPTLNGIQYLLAPIRLFVDTIGQGIADLLAWIWENFSESVDSFLKPVIQFLSWLWQGAPGGFGGFGAQVESMLKPLTEWLYWVWDQFGSGDFLQPLFATLKTIWDAFGGGTLLEDLFGFFNWAWNGISGGFAGFSGAVESVLKPIVEWLHWLFGTLFGSGVTPLTNIFTALHGLLDGSGSLMTWIDSVPLLGPLVEAITGATGTLDDLVEHFKQVPIIKELVGILTGKTELDGVALDLTTLGNWANDVLTKFTQVPANNLIGSIPQALLASIPLSNINFTTPNLLAQGDFGSTGTIDPASGWAWDSTIQYPDGSSGGSAKVTCNSTTRTLYSNQVIKVAAGDKLNMSAYVKSSSTFSGSGTSIVIGLVPFAGTSQQSAVPFASRGSTSAAWAQMVGAGSYAPWTVTSGITSVRPYLQVTSAATAGSVNFDTVSLTKSGLLSGDWMSGIMGTVASDFQAIVDKVIQAIKGTVTGGTGNPLTGILTSLQSIFNTLFNIPQLPTSLASNPLLELAIPGLQASKITSGSFGSDYIASGAITTAKLGAGAVDTTALGTGAVTSTRISAGAVDTTALGSGAVTSGKIGANAVGTSAIADNAVNNNKVTGVDGSKINSGTVSIDHLSPTDISIALGTTGSGGKMSRRTETGTYNCEAGANGFVGDFYDTIDETSVDITASKTLTRFTVTYAGWYLVEVGFNANSSPPGAGYFNVAPAVYTSTSAGAPYKIGSDSLGSYGGGFGNYSRSAQGSFIVYLPASGWVAPGYYNYGSSQITSFFKGKTGGYACYFSISMLNRSVGG